MNFLLKLAKVTLTIKRIELIPLPPASYATTKNRVDDAQWVLLSISSDFDSSTNLGHWSDGRRGVCPRPQASGGKLSARERRLSQSRFSGEGADLNLLHWLRHAEQAIEQLSNVSQAHLSTNVK